MTAEWICCQLGAREHYATARALHRRRRLRALVTDAWMASSVAATLVASHERGRRLRDRYSPDLHDAEVHAFTASLLTHELQWRAQGASGWPLMIARNKWYQRRAARTLRKMAPEGASTVVFAHSYAALEIFQAARERGCRLVLGQIDPGVEHLRIAAEAAAARPEYGDRLDWPPDHYFAEWREECRLADVIVVNSDWSRSLLERAGVPAAKLAVLPIPYETEAPAAGWSRAYPDAFSAARPLRVLYVGTASVIKGVPFLLEAMNDVVDMPVELHMVGGAAATIPREFLEDARIRWHGAVPRNEVMAHYRAADVLVFPSLSDGFGMAQVEAQGWQLPVIASSSSGRVVRDGINGLLLSEVSAGTIAAAIRRVAAAPALLQRFATNAVVPISLDALGDALASHVRALPAHHA